MFAHRYEVQPKKRIGNGGVIAGIFFITLISAGIMYLSIYALPLSDSTLNYALITLAVIFIGLAAPYWILKLIFHEAHTRNKNEKEPHLKDIPKDQEQLKQEENKR